MTCSELEGGSKNVIEAGPAHHGTTVHFKTNVLTKRREGLFTKTLTSAERSSWMSEYGGLKSAPTVTRVSCGTARMWTCSL